MAVLKDLSQQPQSKPAARVLDIRVSEKGGVSVYGLQRFPVTLYREQWDAILNNADQLREFIIAHSAELKVKGEQ